MHHRMTEGLESGMRSNKVLQGTKSTNFTKVPFKIKGHHSDVHKTNFVRSYVPTKTKNTTTCLAIHSNEKKYVVDSGASLHMMGSSALNHEVFEIHICRKQRHAIARCTYRQSCFQSFCPDQV